MVKETISVIVPVYNVERYLEKCLESLLAQTYPYLEIVLVDDGSTDSSLKICERYSETDSRIKVIHKKNGGAASARNLGLSAAGGEYIAFVDSDDYLEPDAYEFMISEMKNNHADVVCGEIIQVYKDHRQILMSQKNLICSAEEYLVEFTRDWTCGMLLNKLFKRVLFDGIYFKEGRVIDDEFFTYRGIMNADKILTASKPVYNYRMRKNSAMNNESHMEQIVLDRLEFLKMRREDVTGRYPQLRDIYNHNYADSILYLIHDPYISKYSIRKAKDQIKEFLKEKKLSGIPLHMRVILLKTYLTGESRLLNMRRHITKTDLDNYFD